MDLTESLNGDEILDMVNPTKGELSLKRLDEIISKTIFEDYPTKIILFLVCLLSYTESDQENVILSGETGVGKTYGINEVLWFFDENETLRFEGATPKSFIHKANAKEVDARTMEEIDYSEFPSKEKGSTQEDYNNWNDKRRNSAFFLDYARKIIVFPDMPDSRLLKNLRPILSHDREICNYDVTEKAPRGLRTKTVMIKGYFTSIFASATTELDEQETSRHFLLSPTDDPKKIKTALELIARKNSDPDFKQWYEEDEDRLMLKCRVSEIQKANIETILLPEGSIRDLQEWFLSKISVICPKTQRDFPRVIALAKAWALLNFKQRKTEKKGDTNILWCTQEDVDIAKELYGPILECNELGLSPEEFGIWTMMKIVCAETSALYIKDIHTLYYQSKKRSCADKRLRGMLVNFCRAGLIREEKDGNKLRYWPILKPKDGVTKIEKPSLAKFSQPSNKKDKTSLVLQILIPNMPMGIGEIQRLITESEIQLSTKEIEEAIRELSSSGRISEPIEGKYVPIQ